MYTACLTFGLMAAFTGLVNADCKTFEPTSEVNTTGFDNVYSFYANRPYGINLGSQTQQVTPGITCHDKKSFEKEFPHNGPVAAVCFGNPCGYDPVGNVYARSMTNLSVVTPADEKANERIMELALKQVRWSKRKYPYVFNTLVRGTIDNGDFCLKKGQSGWGTFVPYFRCLSGRLKGCNGGGSGLEQDGQNVGICMPFAIDFKDEVPQVPGGYPYHLSSASEARAHRANPALHMPAPEGSAISVHGARSGLLTGLAFLVWGFLVFA